MAGDPIHDDDPFAIFMRPPENETSAERATREAREAMAKERTEAIDEELRTERQTTMRTSRSLLKAVLLGSSQSGKSRFIQQLRMRYAPDDLEAEQRKWGCAIHLKILTAVVTILDALQSELDGEAMAKSSADARGTTYPSDPPSPPGHVHSGELDTSPVPDALPGEGGSIQDKDRLVLLRLGPVRRTEENLRRWFDASNEATSSCKPGKESEEATSVIAQYKEDINSLWKDESVKLILQKNEVKLEESAESLLDDLDRICSSGYTPSEEDIAHVGSTAGIREYRIKLKGAEMDRKGGSSEQHMCLYDIGNSRMARQVWIPYLEGVDAVMFFSSLSWFDERLPEDPRVNRLEDSFLLWRMICGSSRLLKPSGLILFLTGCDVLRDKLKRGVQVKDTVPSYGDRPNDPDVVVKYFREMFRQIARQNLDEPLAINTHLVAAVDFNTAGVLSNVKEIVLCKLLRQTRE